MSRVSVFHGTDERTARLMLRYGVRKRYPGFLIYNTFFVTDSKSVARYYAAFRSAEDHTLKQEYGRARGAVLQVTVDSSKLKTDDYAYVLEAERAGQCPTNASRVPKKFWDCVKKVRPPAKGADSLREIGAAFYDQPIPPTDVRLVEWVKPSRAQLREFRPRAREALRINPSDSLWGKVFR